MFLKNVPNISLMKLKEKVLDPYLYKFGLKRNLGSRFQSEAGPNSKLNKYLNKQRRRLSRFSKTGDPRFWKLQQHLVKSSKAFRMLALFNVSPNWFKDQSWNRIWKALKDLNGICYNTPSTHEIKRTGIPKADGSLRYINDAGIAWRMYLWMENHLGGIWLNDRIHPNQHGHRPGKGTVSAWRGIKELYEKYPYVYEFDYTKFHDRIERLILMKSLQRMGLPESMVTKYIHLMSPWIRGIDENDPIREVIGIPDPNNNHGVTLYNHFFRGVVQGSNLAALMGLSVLEYMKVYDLKDGEYLGYADDGLLFGNSAEVVEELKNKLEEDSGITLKEEKSGWVKFSGKYVKDVKFIGLRIDRKGDIYAATHSGKDWKFEWMEDLELSKELDTFRKEGDYDRRKPRILNFDNGRKYLGFLLSKIWSDTPYEDLEKVADRTLRYRKNSLLGIYGLPAKWKTIEFASTFCHEMLTSVMKSDVLSVKKKRVNTGYKTNMRIIDNVICKEGVCQIYRGRDYLVGTYNKHPVPEMVDLSSHPNQEMWEYFITPSDVFKNSFPMEVGETMLEVCLHNDRRPPGNQEVYPSQVDKWSTQVSNS